MTLLWHPEEEATDRDEREAQEKRAREARAACVILAEVSAFPRMWIKANSKKASE